jgi:hypothetical protein
MGDLSSGHIIDIQSQPLTIHACFTHYKVRILNSQFKPPSSDSAPVILEGEEAHLFFQGRHLLQRNSIFCDSDSFSSSHHNSLFAVGVSPATYD